MESILLSKCDELFCQILQRIFCSVYDVIRDIMQRLTTLFTGRYRDLLNLVSKTLIGETNTRMAPVFEKKNR